MNALPDSRRAIHVVKRRITIDTYLGETDAVVTVDYWPGRPAVMYLRNGDPGYPEDPPELEIVSMTLNGEPYEPTEREAEDLIDRLLQGDELYEAAQ